MAGTMPMAKAPRTILIRYRAPAILANWRGAVPVMESINGPSPTMPTAPGRVSVVGWVVGIFGLLFERGWYGERFDVGAFAASSASLRSWRDSETSGRLVACSFRP